MAKNVTVTPADGDIQFENTSGTAAGRIEQSGDDLVISNAVGDVLFGDTNSDVYIGDGVNSVDLLFEQSGSIKAEDGSSGVTLTLGSSDTTLSLYAPQLTTTMTIGSGGSIDFTPDTGTVLSFDSQSIIRRLNANGGVSIGHDDQVIIAGGDTSSVMDSNVSGEVVAIGAEGGLLVYGFPNNNTSWSNRVQFSFNNDGKMYFGTASDTNIYRSAANTLKTDDSFVVGSRLYVTTLDANTTSTSALVLGASNEIEKRTLGSNAFNSTAFTTNTGTVTSVTVGTGLDVANGTTTPSITLDLSELTDMTANVNTSQDELILLDNGAERRKLFSEIFGSAAYSNSSAFISASNADTASELITFSKGISSDGNSKFYNWRALDNSSNSGNFYWHIGTITGSQSTRFMVTIAGRSTSYSDNMLPAMGHIVGQFNNDNNYDIVFYNHSTASSEVVTEVGIVDDGTDSVHLYVKTGNYAELTATAHISDGRITTNSNSSADGTSSAPDGYATVTEYTSYNSGNLTAGQNVSISSGVIASSHPAIGQTAGTYGNTANGTKIDTITIDENGHVTNIATGATGNMTGFFVEDGDGTEVQITNAKEWKFVEGTGIDIDWTDTSTGNDSDPYDLTFAIKNNSIGIDQLNVTDGTNGQVLTTNGSGTLSFSTVTSGSSYGWSLNGTDIESGDSISLAGGLSFDSSTNTLSQTDNNTTYSNATTSADGLMSSTDKTKLDGIASGAEVNVQSDWNATSGDAFIQNKPNLFDGAYSSLSGVPSTFAPSSHNHDGRYYTESEMQHFMARALGWVSGYGNPAEGYVNYDFTNDAVEISGGGDNTTGGVFKAIRVKSGDKVRFTVMLKGSASSTSGLYLRLYQHNGNLPDGKTHVSNNATSSEGVVQEDDAGDTSWEENRPVPSAWTTYEHTYTAAADGYVSLVVLNWSGHEEKSIYIKQPDIQFEKVNDASKLGGTAASSYLTAHPSITEATTNLSNSGRTYIQSITLDSNGHVTGVSTGTETVTNSNTTYSAGSGLDLTGTTFSVEADLRDGITHVGKDTSNYITFDSTNSRIDFYAGGTFVARMESDGDLHIKGDVIAFSNIFS